MKSIHIDRKITKNKVFSVQIEFGKNAVFSVFELGVKVTEQQDHAGFNFTFCIKNLIYYHVMIYGRRHWDDDNQCFIDSE